MDGEPFSGGEGQPAGVVGVTFDGEVTAVVGVVMERAQAGQVPGVGGSAVDPVDQVVALDVGGGVAAGEPAAAVAVLDQAPGPVGDDALGAAHVDRGATGVPDRLQDPVAGQLVDDVPGQPGSPIEPAAVGIEVDVGPERVPAVDRPDRAQGTLADLGQGVSPAHLGPSGAEQGVLGLLQRRLDQGAEVGGGAEPQGEPAPLVIGHGQLRGCGRAVLLAGEAVPARRPARGSIASRAIVGLGRAIVGLAGPCIAGLGVAGLGVIRTRGLGIEGGDLRPLARRPGRVERVPGQGPPQLWDRGVDRELGHRRLHMGGRVSGHHNDLVQGQLTVRELTHHRRQLTTPPGDRHDLPGPKRGQPRPHDQPVLR